MKIDPRDDLAAPHQADAQVRQAEATMKNVFGGKSKHI